jgi:hypothetical protein
MRESRIQKYEYGQHRVAQRALFEMGKAPSRACSTTTRGQKTEAQPTNYGWNPILCVLEGKKYYRAMT